MAFRSRGFRRGWIATALIAAAPVVWLAGSGAVRAQSKATLATLREPAAAGSWPAAKPDASGYIPEATIADLMTAIVMPSAQTIWDAVSVDVTDKGEVQKIPTTDEEWDKLRWTALTLSEATNLLVTPGRHVDQPGVKSENPDSELSPEQIEPLIAKNRAAWVGYTHVLHAASLEALKAIDARNVDGISEAGGTIDAACEACHLQFWYPNQDKPNQDKK